MYRRLAGLGLLVAVVLVPAAGMARTSPQAAGRPKPGSIGIRLVDAPARTRADLRTRRYIIDHLPPGTVIHRRVEVSNTSDSPRHLLLYPAAATVKDRRFQFGAGRAPDELSTWTATSRRELDLGPHAASMVMLTITVPHNASPGERYGVVWAETSSSTPSSGGITQVNRVGIRMYLSVGPGRPPPSSFTIDSLIAQRSATGLPAVAAQVHNTGGRALDLDGTLRLSQSAGSLSAGPFRVQSGTTLAPGESGTVTVHLGQELPDGPWVARIRLQSGLTEQTARATIVFPRRAATAAAPVEAEMETGHSTTLVAILIAAILVAIGTAIASYRSRRWPGSAARRAASCGRGSDKTTP